MKENRVGYFDVMRVIGIFAIMIAHANPPGWLFQLRNFGTPLLIVASALTYSHIYSKNKILDTSSFYKKRLMRLTLPVWLFLIFFFTYFYLESLVFESRYPFTSSDMLGSFGLYGGIGYVWVLGVYIFLAIITPVALKVRSFNISNTKYFFSVVVVYIVNEILLYIVNKQDTLVYRQELRSTLFTFIPYGLLYLYGMRMASLDTKTIIKSCFLFFLIFVVFGCINYVDAGYVVSTQKFKYPPTAYYLSYALFCINIIYLVLSKYASQWSGGEVVGWLASNSLWIYLWHIFGVYIWDFNFEEPGNFLLFMGKMLFILSVGVVFTFLQKKIVHKIFNKNGTLGRFSISLLT